ncbi:hypothetical protein E2C01_032516 [Portunus trituberculatus]|uniref:Uncharacterized protein n=1 Tax=Portunus trituberculatus TaxID=210409 RepID=A0A5B7F0H4_PORTR|nr:hypothetical protein [Portunus trituberculatus]
MSNESCNCSQPDKMTQGYTTPSSSNFSALPKKNTRVFGSLEKHTTAHFPPISLVHFAKNMNC